VLTFPLSFADFRLLHKRDPGAGRRGPEGARTDALRPQKAAAAACGDRH